MRAYADTLCVDPRELLRCQLLRKEMKWKLPPKIKIREALDAIMKEKGIRKKTIAAFVENVYCEA